MSFRKNNIKLENQLSLICSNAGKLSDKAEITFDDLFPETFMKIHTQCNSIEEFMAPLGVETNEDFENVPDDKLEEHIQNNTNFSNWKDMKHSAWSDFLSEQLGF
ncbi:hypothetical protein [Companilactobacillus sp.]|jgi:hypothetical protein|uniref:hypothetical protein n=1 Tax=Companilactobacillus sp. TaxID=2767905 RepID=UPI0025BDED81|nr:hypothetical protein [Companilactobacillus sp.]MCH4007952.1 hypothetical protein [Companilactobacillus sp.]MCH4051869.1 hypothetical protein [Companilactobacillus sp.]MCH4075895.1 hypothetical protein [Companilactobacillus sp.]MCH4124470.1 hypothetical protein [Companilactobacillus sp.]MCH4132567.1 hypothetical protein [Companilactobacillus sp.]